MEDHFGHSGDSRRANKNPFKTLAMERFHLQCSCWTRLDEESWPKMEMIAEDFSSTKGSPYRKVANVGSYAPDSTVLKRFHAACLQKKGLVIQRNEKYERCVGYKSI